jgi:hypothetical protein
MVWVRIDLTIELYTSADSEMYNSRLTISRNSPLHEAQCGTPPRCMGLICAPHYKSQL